MRQEGGWVVDAAEEPTERWNNEMARGKGGLSSNVVLVTTRPRRAASMPAPEHYTPYTSYVAPSLSGVRASRATSHALDETEVLSHQSRRNDQRLLDDITSRLAYKPTLPRVASSRESRPLTRRAHYYQRPTPVTTYTTATPSSYYSPRYSGASYGNRAYSSPSANQALRTWRSMSAIPPAPEIRATPRKSCARYYDDDDEDLHTVSYPTYKSSAPKRSFEYERKRAQSVPAFTTRAPVTTHLNRDKARMENWFIDRQSPLLMMADHIRSPTIISPSKSCLSIFDVYQPPRAPRRPVLRTQAPITRASSPPRLTYRSSSLPPTRRYTPSADLAVRNAKSILGRLERDMGSDDVDADAYDYGYTPAVSYRPPMAPARATPSRHLYRSTQAVPSRRYYQSTTPRIHPAEIESKVDYYAEPDLSPPYTGNLRARFSETRNKMDTHRTMMDKYLPIDMGPGNEVAYEVETKYGELANRDPGLLMPQLEPYRPNKRACSLPPPGRRASVCSTRGLSEYASQPLRTPTFRPTMSDTRKRCRDVLCKTKGDPRYFDY